MVCVCVFSWEDSGEAVNEECRQMGNEKLGVRKLASGLQQVPVPEVLAQHLLSSGDKQMLTTGLEHCLWRQPCAYMLLSEAFLPAHGSRDF